MVTAAKQKTLDVEMSFGTQGIAYKELLNVHGHKVKINIYSDSYKTQCYARLSVLEMSPSMKWNVILSIPFANMQTREGMIYEPAVFGKRAGAVPAQFEMSFKADRDTLIAKFKKLVA